MSFYRFCLRPILFRCDPEWIHNCTISLGEKAGARGFVRRALDRFYRYENDRLAISVAGLQFPNPVGLAAGFDKNGRMIQALAAVGFGFIEIGSISAHSSLGNPRPRLFRLPLDQAVVVNYGVPNDGAGVVAGRIADKPTPVPLGVNLVETNTGTPTQPDQIIEELVEAVGPFVQRADYICLSLNCPNTTAGVSPFDHGDHLSELMHAFASIDQLPPVLLKLTAHTDQGRMEEMLLAIEPFDFVKGFIFNMPPGKPYSLRTPSQLVDSMPGTLCGHPTRLLTNQAIGALYKLMDRKRYRIIGGGGIASSDEAYEKIRLGASLLQLYTALIFEGPALVRRIKKGLVRLLDRDGFGHVGEAVGADHE